MNEHTKNAITASVGFVPILGGALSVLFDKYIPTTFEKKRDDFFRYIDSEFEKLGIDENSSILEEEKFMMLFTKCFKRAMDEHSEEKIKAFQHVILNSATIENENLDETTFFIRLISDLTIDQSTLHQRSSTQYQPYFTRRWRCNGAVYSPFFNATASFPHSL